MEQQKQKQKQKQIHFVLVHGACHGAWCWFKVAALLKSAGHQVTALDMSASGINQKDPKEVRSFGAYFEPLIDFMGGLEAKERVVLVGHSMGGFCISAAMEMFPDKICVAVFVTAFMLGPDLTYSALSAEFTRSTNSEMGACYKFDNGPDKPPTSFFLQPDIMASKFYQLSSPEDLSLALMLVRPMALYDDESQVEEEMIVTREKFGSVARVYIVCNQDYAIKEDMQRWMIERSPTNEVKVIYGSDHMVMFSKPIELFSCLDQIARDYF